MVFLEDACLWPSCGATFTCVEDLIHHVEDIHIRAHADPLQQLISIGNGGGAAATSTIILPAGSSSTSTTPSAPVPAQYMPHMLLIDPDSGLPATIHLSYVSRYFSEQELVRRRSISGKATKVGAASVAPAEKKGEKRPEKTTKTDKRSHTRPKAAVATEQARKLPPSPPRPALAPPAVKRPKVTTTMGAGPEPSKQSSGSMMRQTGPSPASTPVKDEGADSAIGSPCETPDISNLWRDLITLSAQLADHKDDKPYVCPLPSCGKRYKNLNGIKYHAMHSHKDVQLSQQPFRCHVRGCTERCGNIAALKQHVASSHPAEPELRVNRTNLDFAALA